MSIRVANRNFSRAFRWQRIVVYLLIAFFAWFALAFLIESTFGFYFSASPIFNFVLLGLGSAIFVSVLCVSYYVFRGTVGDRGLFYASFYAALIIVLIPAMFAGVFTIPTLLNGDAIRRRNWDKQQRMAGG